MNSQSWSKNVNFVPIFLVLSTHYSTNAFGIVLYLILGKFGRYSLFILFKKIKAQAIRHVKKWLLVTVSGNERLARFHSMAEVFKLWVATPALWESPDSRSV